jgi:hypothetical protein
VHSLSYKLTLVFISLFGIAQASDTLIIKKYKRPSKALLNRKIIYMDMGEAPRSQNSAKTSSLSALSAPVSTRAASAKTTNVPEKQYNVSKIQGKKFNVNKLGKKQKLASIGKSLKKSFGRSKEDSGPGVGEYNDEDWGDYTEYKEVELEESLGVSAKIRRR